MKTSILTLLAVMALSTGHGLAQSRESLHRMQRSANFISSGAARLEALLAMLSSARYREVVPDGIYRMLETSIGALAAEADRLVALAEKSGHAGLAAEARGVRSMVLALPKGNEISEVILRMSGKGNEISEVVLMQEALSALRRAAPCIRREIQELDE